MAAAGQLERRVTLIALFFLLLGFLVGRLTADDVRVLLGARAFADLDGTVADAERCAGSARAC